MSVVQTQASAWLRWAAVIVIITISDDDGSMDWFEVIAASNMG